MQELHELVLEYTSQAIQFASDYNIYIALIAACTLGVGIGYIMRDLRVMSPQRKAKVVREFTMENFIDALDYAEFNGMLTRQEIEGLVAIIAQADKKGRLKELPLLYHKARLENAKVAIKKRLGNGAHKPVNIPGEPPPKYPVVILSLAELLRGVRRTA